MGKKIGISVGFSGYYEIFLRFFFRIYVVFDVLAPTTPTTTMNTPQKRKRGAELSVGRRTAMAVEIALVIPPGKTRVPKGILGPLAERYRVGPDLNVNNLGFFASLKSRVWGMNASSIDE